MDDISQLQKEWLVVNGSREALSLIKKKTIPYSESIKFAKQVAPNLFSNTGIGAKRKNVLEKVYEKYEQEALANSRRSGKSITAKMLLDDRIKELEKLLNYYDKQNENPDALKREKAELIRTLDYSPDKILNVERILEGQAINHDANAVRADKMFLKNHLGKYTEYRNKDNGGIFRVNILHPNPSEAVIGADLIYEHYSLDAKLVRIAAIQYKIWKDDVLYFSTAANLENQIQRMNQFFCEKKYCLNHRGERSSNEYFRLPFCCAFLRPTDELQDPNKLITSGFHLPICQIDRLKQLAYKDYKLERESIKSASLSAESFEKLFNDEMVGSRWLEIDELESLYKNSKILEPQQNILIHVQNAVDKEESSNEEYPF